VSQDDHEAIDELLAGYALLALSGPDADEADRLLSEHVPACPRCRRTLADLQAITGDLALGAPPVAPPETVLPRLHRAMDEVPLAGRAPRRGAFIAVAASIAALVAMGGLSLTLGSRLSDAQTRAGTALEILSLMRSPGVQPVSLTPQGSTPPSSELVEVSAPSVQRLYLAAEDCPDPSPGKAYQLWLGSQGTFVPVGEMFRPQGGVVLLELAVDTSRYDEIWITEETIGAPPAEPSIGGPSWRAEL
jgi:hypothetical protein